MLGPEGRNIMLMGCPRCGRNAIIDASETPYLVEDGVVNIATDIQCPHNSCGASFTVDDSEILWRSDATE